MKNFIVQFGNRLIDIVAWLTIIGTIITSVVLIFSGNFLSGLSVLLGGLIVFVATFYLIYLVISVNDNLEEIKNCLKEKSNRELDS